MPAPGRPVSAVKVPGARSRLTSSRMRRPRDVEGDARGGQREGAALLVGGAARARPPGCRSAPSNATATSAPAEAARCTVRGRVAAHQGRPGGHMLAALRYRRAQTIVVVVLAALVTTCLVLAPLYTRALEQAMIRTMLREATVAQTGLRLGSTSPTAPQDALDPDALEQLPPGEPADLRRVADRQHGRRRAQAAVRRPAGRSAAQPGGHVRARDDHRRSLSVGARRGRRVGRPGQGLRDAGRVHHRGGGVRRRGQLPRGGAARRRSGSSGSTSRSTARTGSATA